MPVVEKASSRILVVEDESAIAHMVRRSLESRGRECVVASNGFEGLQKVCVEFFDLIISDICMPVMTGIEFARRMRLLAWYKTTPLIFLTAKRFEIDEAALVDELSLAAVVAKPFRPSTLDELVTKTLEETNTPALHAVDQGGSAQFSYQHGNARRL